MRTSLNEIKEIEDWVMQSGELPDRLVTEAKMLIDPSLKDKAEWQLETYKVVKAYGRRKLQDELIEVESKLFSEPQYKVFQRQIHSIFKMI